ncbi:MAG: response regulator [Planctomycetes bacterium]|nr:response regulator [Planctomycetota bacterium]
MTLASSLVQLQGGHIEARSDGPGKGSEFIVSLPLMASKPQSNLPVDRPANGERSRIVSLPACRILIVDDTRASAFVLGKLLETMGQEIETATSGESAIAQTRAMRPDLVISDIGMPGMDGYELARRLRQEPGLEGLVLAALTGYGQDSDREQAKQAGFDYHLVKPVSLEALEDLLNEVRRAAVAR